MYEIQERTLVEQPTMVMRGKIKLEDIPTFLSRAYHMVDTQIREGGAHVVGEPFARYRSLDPEYRELVSDEHDFDPMFRDMAELLGAEVGTGA